MWLKIRLLIFMRPFHIVPESLQKKYSNDKPQLYYRDSHVQVLITFND